jgi:pimeloyl-ACP methyl ester carboxylesterase
MRIRVLVLLVVVAFAIAGSASARPAALHGAHPCPGTAGFTCETLDVPLDRADPSRGTLHLHVGAGDNVNAPHGVLLVLSGGPGQPGLPILGDYLTRALSAEQGKYRIVVFDQRGTGAGALDCTALQHEMGSSDLTEPTAQAVRACARKLGARRQFFGTDDVVADMDALRQALGVDTWSLDGISYGTYVGERYALAHPSHVSKLVLDSVVPQVGEIDLGLAEFAAVRRVLRSVCGSRCVSDLARVVRRDRLGPQLLDALTFDSIADPTYRRFWNVPAALHDASHGNRKRLNAFPRGRVALPARHARGRPRPGLARERALRRLAVSVGELGRAARRAGRKAPCCGGANPGREALSVRRQDGVGQRLHPPVPALGADRTDAPASRQAPRTDAAGQRNPRPLDSARVGPQRAPAGDACEAGRRPGRRTLGAGTGRQQRRPPSRRALPAGFVTPIPPVG